MPSSQKKFFDFSLVASAPDAVREDVSADLTSSMLVWCLYRSEFAARFLDYTNLTSSFSRMLVLEFPTHVEQDPTWFRWSFKLCSKNQLAVKFKEKKKKLPPKPYRRIMISMLVVVIMTDSSIWFPKTIELVRLKFCSSILYSKDKNSNYTWINLQSRLMGFRIL